ncbi:MAG: hypothetical protein FJ293_16220 [Planctomycetes bacterium]|nr:hypothetical protein [Planctomycetota bacterium]
MKFPQRTATPSLRVAVLLAVAGCGAAAPSETPVPGETLPAKPAPVESAPTHRLNAAPERSTTTPARFLIAAGDAALQTGNLDAARRHFEGALSLTRDVSAAEGAPLREAFLAHDRLGSLADRLGALEDAADHYLRALDLQQVAPEPAAPVAVRARLAGIRRRQGDRAAAERELALARSAIAVDAAPATAALVYRELGRLRLGGAPDDVAAGLSALAQACSLYERAGLPAAVAACRLERGKALLSCGEARQAIAECSRAHGLFAREEVKGHEHAGDVIAALQALADGYEQLGDAATATSFRRRARERQAQLAATPAVRPPEPRRD